MARSRTLPPISDEEREEATAVLLPLMDESEDRDLQDAYDQWREDLRKSETPAILRVFRVPTDVHGQPLANAKHQGDLFSCPMDAMGYEDVIEKIRREFIRPPNFSITVRVMAIKRKSESEPARTLFNRIVTVERGADLQPSKNSDGVAELIRVVQENANRQMEMMRQLFESRSQVDPIELSMRLTQQMTAMVAAMGGGGARTSMKDTLEMLALAKGLNSSGGTMKEMIETFGMVKTMLGDLSGNENPDDGDTPAGIIKAVSPLASPIFEALKAYNENQAQARRIAAERLAIRRKQLPNAASQRPVSGVPKANESTHAHSTVPNVEVPVQTSVGENPMLKVLREQIETLVVLAAENADPKALVEGIMEMIPEEFDDKVWQFVSSDSCMTLLKAMHPKVKEHEEWFANFRQAIINEYTADAVDEKPAEFTPEHELSAETRARLVESGRLKS